MAPHLYVMPELQRLCAVERMRGDMQAVVRCLLNSKAGISFCAQSAQAKVVACGRRCRMERSEM